MRVELRGSQQVSAGPNDIISRELCAMRAGVESLLMVNKGMADMIWKGMLPMLSRANELGPEMIRAAEDLQAARDAVIEAADRVTRALDASSRS